jgi:hypothetical protein
MKYHYLRSNHKEGERHVNLNDGRALVFEKPDATIAIPCEGETCPFCNETVKLTDVTTKVASESAGDPTGFKDTTKAAVRTAINVKITAKAAAVAEVG